jgi:Na+-translocating ferredoxin:NAD+ oxidoreductase RnfC subunit
VLHHFEAGNEFRTVEILCDKFHARMILAAAEMYCPEAVAEIEEAIRLSRTLH